ncbi:hypothetical protein [Streptomyces sp. NPDC053069]|uniref:hypothetical protein n=1 Tax=Streptomyces sp. NPDC053069 TaxID=3365695 RepID=UPI0037D17AF8
MSRSREFGCRLRMSGFVHFNQQRMSIGLVAMAAGGGFGLNFSVAHQQLIGRRTEDRLRKKYDLLSVDSALPTRRRPKRVTSHPQRGHSRIHVLGDH